jgi:ABC-2 type transport system ATP-binding protein
VALSFSGVVVRYPGGDRAVLAGVDLSIAAGERVAVMGPNGSGKSSALAVWAGLVAPAAGEARVLGVDPVRSPADAARLVGWATAEGSGFSARLSVVENLRFSGSLYGVSDLDGRLGALEPVLDLEPLLSKRFQTLSAGQRARVAVARALLHSPRVLLLDEVTRVFDPGVSSRVHAMLRRLAAEGVVVVLVTHDRAEAGQMSRVILLDHGGVQADGAPAAVAPALDVAFGVSA